jgi:hypothetical protein
MKDKIKKLNKLQSYRNYLKVIKRAKFLDYQNSKTWNKQALLQRKKMLSVDIKKHQRTIDDLVKEIQSIDNALNKQ